MSEHKVDVVWERESEDFSYNGYNREHSWSFEGGTVVRASAAPGFLGDAACVDPEEAFVASLSSCHMLTFLAIASKKKYVVDRYEDSAVGALEKVGLRKMMMTHVTLRPRVTFAGAKMPSERELQEMHHKAHGECFIANSVKTEVVLG